MCDTRFSTLQQYLCFNFTFVKSSLKLLETPKMPHGKGFPHQGTVSVAYLNNVENHVLVEAVQDALGHSVVAPGTMDQQELL